MGKVVIALLCGFICYMACTKLPVPTEEKSVLITKADTVKTDSSNQGSVINVDTTLNNIEHFIRLSCD